MHFEVVIIGKVLTTHLTLMVEFCWAKVLLKVLAETCPLIESLPTVLTRILFVQ